MVRLQEWCSCMRVVMLLQVCGDIIAGMWLFYVSERCAATNRRSLCWKTAYGICEDSCHHRRDGQEKRGETKGFFLMFFSNLVVDVRGCRYLLLITLHCRRTGENNREIRPELLKTFVLLGPSPRTNRHLIARPFPSYSKGLL